MNNDITEAARTLGQVKSPAKTAAARENGKKGGRPAIDLAPFLALIEEDEIGNARYYRNAYPKEWRKARRLNKLNVWKDDTGAEYVEAKPQQF